MAEIELNKAIFSLPWNDDLVNQAVKTNFANKRQVLASVKDRSEVRGGARKPWRQKGTGRARHGSIRSPLWKGGGVTFGPEGERNFKLKINKKMAKKATLIILSAKARDNELLILEDLTLPLPKTREMVKVMSKFSEVKNALLVLSGASKDIQMAARNLPNVKTTNINNLNILDILKYKHLIFTRDGIEELNKKYADNK